MNKEAIKCLVLIKKWEYLLIFHTALSSLFFFFMLNYSAANALFCYMKSRLHVFL